MTYKAMQDAVLLDAFPEIRRPDAMNWIQFTHSRLWDHANWTFKNKTQAASVAAGSQICTLVSGFSAMIALLDESGCPLIHYPDIQAFFTDYNAAANPPGLPEAYTVVGQQIFVGPTSSVTSSAYLAVYGAPKPALTIDTSTTGLPDAYDMALVFGGKGVGFTLVNNPFSDDFEREYQMSVKSLEEGYLSDWDTVGDQTPAYRPY